MDQTLQVLVEGYDINQEVVAGNHQEHDKDWEEVYRSRQTNTIMQSEVIGIEENSLGEKTFPCAVVYIGNVKGIVPLEFMNVENYRDLRRMTGQKIAFKVVGLDKKANLFIANRTAAIEHMAGATWKKIETGLVVLGVVRRVARNLIHVDIGGVSAKLEIDEYGYGWNDDLRKEVKEGDHLKVKLLSVDKDKKTVKISRKATLPNPWDNISNRFSVDGEYVGTVSGVVNYGNFINLAPGIDALTQHMRFTKLSTGDKVLVKIRDINVKDQKINAKIVRKI
ncbi:S1 RNA-binding domain-containing protein [Anaerobacillus isosaccharinicus]|uniref:30S ribosomal protein S1 n=1 Tax=Anaerobacillus isosaccharinicus TaxID=1532552 RepID=A0A1S2L2Z4_9BACI|nr:S1 RNA-binding domain-containing protein [Anaerobacillus isosaccharinicus]MBA5588938.1 30S ribosomal protein S1 [Anaerobacillus isosaccharinicus]QOY37652.1 30S ribosomal protein S1 [Anaerobacillus isosaccharinicus]